MITSIKVRPIISFLVVIFIGIGLCFLFKEIEKTNIINAKKLNCTIVLDAGHGGIDNGSSGIKTGVSEAEINLKVTKKLEKLLQGFGFNVVLTRKDSSGLYSSTAKNKKQDDMAKRKQIIEKSKPNMVVSIHMNSYVNDSEKGAQTFYLKDNLKGKRFAQNIQNELKKHLVDARSNVSCGDLYILKCYNCPSVIVEGGFLSNNEDESLLVTNDYQEKIAYSIFCGIIKFFTQEREL